MQLYRLRRRNGVLHLNREQQASPTPGVREVAVRITAASLNYRDLLILGERYGGDAEGVIPLSDGVGVVTAVGGGVTRFKVGDRVAGCFFQHWSSGNPTEHGSRSALGGQLPGVLAEEVCLCEEGVIHFPDFLTDEEASTLPCAALTAWNSLFTRGALHNQQSVLLMGTGGVSLFGLQFAVAAGARTIITSSSNAKLDRARSLGANETINYRTHPEWDAEVLKLTNGQGVDQIIEVGGSGTLERSLQALNYGGHIGLVGVLAGQSSVDPFPLALRNGTISGIYVGSREQFEAMNHFIDKHQIHPVVDRVFSFADAPRAYEYLASGKHFGKVVIRVGG